MRTLPIIAALLITTHAAAQTEPPDLLVMRTPNSPAFVALGVSPTEIQRPTTPAAFAADVVSRFRSSDGNLTIPQGLAVEVAPYWMVPHYDLTWKDYANEAFSSIYRNATLSLATAPTAPAAPAASGETPPSSGTDLALGVRTTIIHPHANDAQLKCVQQIADELTKAAKVDNVSFDAEIRKRAAAEWERLHPGVPVPTKENAPEVPDAPDEGAIQELPVHPTLPEQNDPKFNEKFRQYQLDLAKYEERIRAFAEAEKKRKDRDRAAAALEEFGKHFAEYSKVFAETTKAVREEADARPQTAVRDAALNERLEPCTRVIQARGDGISVDVASAIAWSYPGTRFENGDFKQFLAWATVGYASDRVTFLGLARYVGRDEGTTLKSGFDLGVRLLYAADRWGISAEFVNRKIDVSEQRYAGGLDFRVTGDTWLTTTFGKDYGEQDKGGLIALANLQFNIGKQRLEKLQKKE